MSDEKIVLTKEEAAVSIILLKEGILKDKKKEEEVGLRIAKPFECVKDKLPYKIEGFEGKLTLSDDKINEILEGLEAKEVFHHVIGGNGNLIVLDKTWLLAKSDEGLKLTK